MKKILNMNLIMLIAFLMLFAVASFATTTKSGGADIFGGLLSFLDQVKASIKYIFYIGASVFLLIQLFNFGANQDFGQLAKALFVFAVLIAIGYGIDKVVTAVGGTIIDFKYLGEIYEGI